MLNSRGGPGLGRGLSMFSSNVSAKLARRIKFTNR